MDLREFLTQLIAEHKPRPSADVAQYNYRLGLHDMAAMILGKLPPGPVPDPEE